MKSMIYLITLLALVGSFTSCDSFMRVGAMNAAGSKSLTSLNDSETPSKNVAPTLSETVAKTPTRLMTSRQYFMSFLTVTGIQRPNTKLLDRFNMVRSVLPTETDMNLLNAPIAMGLTNLAGTTCEQMYDDELSRKPNQRFFLEGNDSENFASINVSTFSERLAVAAWGDVPSQKESALFDAYYDEFKSTANKNDNQKKTAKGFLVSLCTAILTAPKSIVF